MKITEKSKTHITIRFSWREIRFLRQIMKFFRRRGDPSQPEFHFATALQKGTDPMTLFQSDPKGNSGS